MQEILQCKNGGQDLVNVCDESERNKKATTF